MPVLYVNGDSNSAGAEAVNSYSFAIDDPLYWALGRQPHPDNLQVSYGCELANMMGYTLECDAESASSNDRIVRTTYERLTGVQGIITKIPDLIIIGWSTWEREEWWDAETNRYWQVNAGGVGHDWPDNIKARYKEYIANINIQECIAKASYRLYSLHQRLRDRKINHVFFNCFEPLSGVHELDWEGCYLNPYDPKYTYYNWLKEKGFATVAGGYHFGPDAHRAWAKFLYQTIVHKALTE